MSRKILIAEDEAFIASLFKTELAGHNTEVDIVGNGQEAIDAIKKKRYDLIFLDLLMPEVDGYAVLSYCLEHQIRIPVVVVLTNYGQDMNKKKCRELGAEDFIVKAEVTADQIWERVKKYLPVE